MRSRLAAERGSALVTAMLVTMIFMMLGLATVSLVDTQQRESGRERVRESAFALSEGLLNSQIYLLSRQWPGDLAQVYPAACTVASGADPRCPDVTTVEAAFSGIDYDPASVQWSTEVRDNTLTAGADRFYDDAVVRAQAGWDSNRDGYLWVRAQAVLNPTSSYPHRRTIVALVNVEELTTMFPRNAIVAGRIKVHPNGNQTYLGTSGSYVTLRCTEPELGDDDCRDWDRLAQVGPNAEIVANPTQPPAMNADAIERMRETARANGTYFASGCVPPASLAGAVVFIERADCSQPYDLPSNQSWNTAQDPGALIIGSGSIAFRGNALYYGVLYHVNGSDGVGATSSEHIVELNGNSCLTGSIVIDGAGGLRVGSSSGAGRCPNGNLQFDANAANRLRAYGTAGIVQNSFREIRASN